MPRAHTDFTIGTLARRAGCSVDTIRFYERQRLLPTPRRTRGGHRLYQESDVERLTFIRRSRRLGLGLDRVRELLDGIERKRYGCGETRALLVACAADLRTRMAELSAMEEELRTMIDACGDAELADCAVIEAMFAEDEARTTACCRPGA